MLVAASICNQVAGGDITLVVVDVETGWVRLLDVASTPATTGATGLARLPGGGLAVCLQGTNEIVGLDHSFEPRWRVHGPELTDLHSCVLAGETLWVASTGRDSIVGVRLDGGRAEIVDVIDCGDGQSDSLHLNAVTVHSGELLASWFGEGWRSRPKSAASGVVVKAASGEVICNGISQPHSVSSVNGRLFVLGSYGGTIEGISPQGRRRLAQFPGYTRGLALGSWGAVVGVSGQRRRSRGPGTDNTDRPDADDRCLILRFDAQWNLVSSVDLSWLAREIYDLVVLPPGLRQPSPADTMEAARQRIANLESRLLADGVAIPKAAWPR